MSDWLGWLRPIMARSRAVVRRRQLDREFDEELTTHLELLIDEGRRHGLSDADARRDAIRKLGQPVALREVHREQRGMPLLDALAQDVRYAVRVLWKSPAFTGIVTLSLALGIGANTALFSLVDDLLLRSLPVYQPERLVQVRQTVRGPGFKKVGPTFPREAFDYVRAHNQVLSEVVGFNQLNHPVVTVDGALEPPRRVERVSDNFFRDLGVMPSLGRTPEPSDDAVAIINDGLWRSRFGRSNTVIGRVLTVDGQPYTIIGIAPPRFLGLAIEQSADVWISSRTAAPQQMIARLKPGVSPAQAQAGLQVLFSQLGQAQPDVVSWDDRSGIELLPAGKGLSRLRAEYERPLLALMVLVTLLLLITCTNVGNLLVVRNTARRRELTMRIALGARRSRLMLQCLVESLVLAVMGGILALVFARWGVSIILSMLPLPAIPEGLAFNADARVLGFAAGVSLLGALLFGLAPAWRATQVDLTTVLRSSQGNTPTKGTRRLGRLLVACQVGLSVLLLVGAGLFVQTLRNLVNRDIGFNPESLLQVSLDTRGSGYQRGQVGPLYRLLVDRVAAIPGVRSVAGIRNPVMVGAGSRCGIQLPGVTLASDETVECADVGPSFFETMNIPVVSGRTFTTADFERSQGFMVINEAFAKRFFPNDDPSGRLPIIGVVRNSRLGAVRGESGPMMYLMLRREPDRFNALEVRSVGDSEGVAQAVQEEIRRVNPRLLIGIRTMRQEIDRELSTERMVAATSAFFALLGLLLVSIGIFGVASYTVSQKTSELGIRMALGAGRWTVIRESLRDTMLVFGAGLAGGIIAAVVAVRLTESVIADLLFGLTPTDATNMVGAVLLMVVVAVAACILPARRATRIDPLAAIRHE
jgi:predicted permease